jgi:hypothetical protein
MKGRVTKIDHSVGAQNSRSVVVLKRVQGKVENLNMTATTSRLDTLVRRPRWMASAACRGEPTDIFFEGYSEQARALCARCTVRAECLSYALADPELIGYWAGTSQRERRRLRLARRAS